MKKLRNILFLSLCLASLTFNKVSFNDAKIEVTYAETISSQQKANLSSSYNNLYESVIEGVVTMVNYSGTEGKYSRQSFGSGFVYDEDSNYYYIMTNQHVVNAAGKMSTIVYTDQEIDVNVIGGDEFQDVAVCKLAKSKVTTKLKVLPIFKDSNGYCINPTVGETVAAVGTPAALTNRRSINFGIVSAIDAVPIQESNDIFEQSHCIQTDTGTNSGNSGGPLINMNGEVLGIVSFKLLSSTSEQLVGMNYAMNIHDMLIIAEKIRTKEGLTQVVYTTRVSLSSFRKYQSVKDVPIYTRAKLGISNFYKGVMLCQEDTSLNLEQNSIIVGINDKEINTVADLRRFLFDSNKGDSVRLKVYKYNKNKIDTEVSYIDTTLVEIDIG